MMITDIDKYNHTQLLRSCYIFGVISFVILTSFAIVHGLQANMIFFYFILANWIIGVLTQTHAYIKKTPKYAKHIIVFQIVGISLFFLMNGGVERTGLLWTFPLPSLLFFFYGRKKGLIVLSLFVFWVTIYLFIIDQNKIYLQNQKIRFILSLTISTIFTYILASNRERAIDALSIANNTLNKLVKTDELTGIYNRHGFDMVASKIIHYHERNNLPYCILLCDLDHFKKINDTYGHDCGDNVLKEISQLLYKSIRKQDILCRWGGEEFIILIPDTRGEQAILLADKLRNQIQKLKIMYDTKIVQITLSIGVGQNSSNTALIDVIKKADENLYRAKETGRNKVVL